MPPGIEHENDLCAQGRECIAGLDEAGRGCWAGPVVAAAVVLGSQVLTCPSLLTGIDDSKALTSSQRSSGYDQICSLAEGVGIGIAPSYVIDGRGIIAATRLAMTIALLSLPCCPDALLIDALTLDTIALPQRSLIRGDAQCLSIAAASVVAKVTRDRLMQTADLAYPHYGFAAHKGYGTALHRRMLREFGPCALHRMTFRPVAELVAQV
ncbi:MAG: ribonuclease HII [Chloroflexales bacterium]|nr:ribonuclease HII [Chloroflexales bacterium]